MQKLDRVFRPMQKTIRAVVIIQALIGLIGCILVVVSPSYGGLILFCIAVGSFVLISIPAIVWYRYKLRRALTEAEVSETLQKVCWSKQSPELERSIEFGRWLCNQECKQFRIKDVFSGEYRKHTVEVAGVSFFIRNSNGNGLAVYYGTIVALGTTSEDSPISMMSDELIKGGFRTENLSEKDGVWYAADTTETNLTDCLELFHRMNTAVQRPIAVSSANGRIILFLFRQPHLPYVAVGQNMKQDQTNVRTKMLPQLSTLLRLLEQVMLLNKHKR